MLCGLAASALAVSAGCGSPPSGPVATILDRHRHARFTADGGAVVYFRHDERPGATRGLFRVDLATGDDRLVVQAVVAGMDVHPTEDLVIFSGREAGEVEPELFVVRLDGTGLRQITSGDVGNRWPAWSADGQRIAWEVRYSNQQGLDSTRTIWIGEWADTQIVAGHPVAPGRRSAWRPDGAALALEQRRPGGVLPSVITVVDTTGRLLDTLGYGGEPVWRPDGLEVAYLADREPDRGCMGICFVAATGGTPRALSNAFMSFAGSWSRDGTEYAYARLMRVYDLSGSVQDVTVDESRLWIVTLATGAERQVTF
jgi:Tol biopolymer transport system component